jgi:hypothetical protein
MDPLDPGELVEAYRTRNLIEAQTLRLLLDDRGIEARIDNDQLQASLGELPIGWSTAPRILVARRDLETARDWIQKFLDHPADIVESAADDVESESVAAASTSVPEPDPAMAGADSVPAPGAEQRPQEEESPGDPPDLAAFLARVFRFAHAKREPLFDLAVVLGITAIPLILGGFQPEPGPESRTIVAPTDLRYDLAIAFANHLPVVALVLLLIHRAGDSFARFTFTTPILADLPLGLAVAVVLEVSHRVLSSFWDTAFPGPYQTWPPPEARTLMDSALLTTQLAIFALQQEFVYRGYLVTRSSDITNSAGWGIALSAVVSALTVWNQGAFSVTNQAIGAIVLATAMLLTGRIWPPVLASLLWQMRWSFLP